MSGNASTLTIEGTRAGLLRALELLNQDLDAIKAAKPVQATQSQLKAA